MRGFPHHIIEEGVKILLRVILLSGSRLDGDDRTGKLPARSGDSELRKSTPSSMKHGATVDGSLGKRRVSAIMWDARGSSAGSLVTPAEWLQPAATPWV